MISLLHALRLSLADPAADEVRIADYDPRSISAAVLIEVSDRPAASKKGPICGAVPVSFCEQRKIGPVLIEKFSRR